MGQKPAKKLGRDRGRPRRFEDAEYRAKLESLAGADPKLTQVEIARLLEVCERTVRRDIKELRAAEELRAAKVYELRRSMKRKRRSRGAA